MLSKLSTELILRATKLQRESEIEAPYSVFYLMAALGYCRQEYTGFSQNSGQQPIPYEEERLRYLMEKLFFRRPRSMGRYMEFILKTEKTAFGPDFSREELLERAVELAKLRKIQVLSADLLLAVAFEHLPMQFEKLLLPIYRRQKISASELIQNADGKIYDYVIDEINRLIEQLQEKAEEAKALRDWRPALAFAEADELEQKLKSTVAVEEKDGYLHLNYPYFFADTAEPLHLTVCDTEQGFVIHDNGCAIAHLKSHLKGGDHKDIAYRICAGTICQVEGEMITTCVTAPYQVGWYLQYISLIANADLYPNYDPKGNVYERGESDRSLSLKASSDYSMIREAITQYQSVSYDEHKGILVGLGLIYLGNSTSARYLFTTAADGIVTIRDYSNSYHEGAIFENYLCYHDDLTECQEQIERIARRFGGVCDGREVTATFRNDQEDAFVRALCRYAQMAVILAQVGYHIPLDSEPN